MRRCRSTTGDEARVNEQPPRRPGGAARLLLLASTAAGFFAVFSVGFPPASRDRLPVFVAALGLALLAAWSPNRGLVAFAFLFPLAGAADRALGGADARELSEVRLDSMKIGAVNSQLENVRLSICMPPQGTRL